jgi:hypothetical protein
MLVSQYCDHFAGEGAGREVHLATSAIADLQQRVGPISRCFLLDRGVGIEEFRRRRHAIR